jgi:cell division septation protein DedD
MEQMTVENHIAALLHEHDCVIVPDFGGFIANYFHARIHPVHHTFFPPSKALLFNINLKQNDGLLASKVALQEGISYEKALDKVRETVVQWTRKLSEQKILVIDTIGKLTQNREGNVEFEQDHNLNFLPDSFGLASFVSPAIRRTGFQEKIEKKITRYMETPGERRRVLPKPLKWAAILILPIGIAAYLGVKNFDTIRNLKIDYSGWFYSSAPAPATKSKPAPKTLTYHAPIYVTPKKPAAVKTDTVVKPVIPKEQKAEVPSQVNAPKPFAVIVGAFKVHENADNLVTDLRQKGFDAMILDTTRTGLFRVSIGTFAQRDQALEQLASVRSGPFSSAWLLAR